MSDWMPSYTAQVVVLVKQYSSSGTPSGVGSIRRTISDMF